MKQWFNYVRHVFDRKSHRFLSKDPMVIIEHGGQPMWTPRSYGQLAQEGYSKNVIVYRAISMIAHGCASIPWIVYDGDHICTHHPLIDLLRQPNAHQSSATFIESVVAYLLLGGNSYVEIRTNHRHEPIHMVPLRPDRCHVVVDRDSRQVVYHYTADRNKRAIPAHGLDHYMLHLKNFHPLNDWYGLSPIDVAAPSIDQYNAVGGHNLAVLQNGGRPTGALVVKPSADGLSRPMTAEQRQALRQDMKELYQGAGNAGRILVLEGDIEWREMGLSPKDLDFIAGKNMSAREIAQAYGVPPMLVGVPGDATFANYREARFHLWEDTILPLMDRLTDEFNRTLASRFGDGIRLAYDSDAIPALAPRREALWSKIGQCDFLTVNEKRMAVGYPPLDDDGIKQK